jgi:hypothetical protein
MLSIHIAKIEKQMSHGLVGPLDLHDPLAPFHDPESSIQALKRSNSLKKLKRINSFRDENSIIEKTWCYQRP